MLSINGLHSFYYLPELHDMRCKAQRICEIIRGRYHRDPLNGDVYMFMSKDQRKVRMIHYERNAYYLHEKSFIKGYKFMKIERKDDVEIALQDGANVNVDETWLRYHAYNKKRKTYMWCLVNRKARIVIFFYEDTTDDEGVQKHGGRNRNVLKEFLGDAKIKSLQSDGYNVYMYLDNELIDIEHLCCLAHARAKFKYAYDQGSLQARIFLELIAFSPPANPDESRSELMSKVLNYLKTFWNQIFAYRNDGEYSIDNMAAERAIRPITVQRKNSLFFGSVKGIQNSAIYNTFIETCKQAGVSFRDYFCRLLRELKKGRTDYENLLPLTICK